MVESEKLLFLVAKSNLHQILGDLRAGKFTRYAGGLNKPFGPSKEGESTMMKESLTYLRSHGRRRSQVMWTRALKTNPSVPAL